MFPYMSPQTLVIGPFTLTNVLATTDQQAVYKWREAGEIVAAQVVMQTGLTGNTTNYKQFKLVNMTNMSAITNVGVLNCIDSVNTVTGVPIALTETQYTFAKDDVLGINIGGGGAPGDLDAGYFIVDYVYGNPASEG